VGGLGLRDLFLVRRPLVFGGFEVERDRARFSLLGFPFDSTSSHRSGQRYGPLFVREASMNIESNGYTASGFVEDVPVYDEGDLAVVHGDVVESVERLSKVVEDLVRDGRRVVVIGGEHVATIGVIRGFRAGGFKPCLLVFDAHLDLRYEYLGVKYSHACTFRRVLEMLGDIELVYVGVRAYAREEMELARSKPGITIITPRNLELLGLANTVASVKRSLSRCESLYVSIDIDVYDPSQAPGVGNPEPGGLTSRELLPLIANTVDERVVGIDVVEVTPPYDVGGVTSILAAKTLQEALITLNLKLKLKPPSTSPPS
jgi:agmatinase